MAELELSLFSSLGPGARSRLQMQVLFFSVACLSSFQLAFKMQ